MKQDDGKPRVDNPRRSPEDAFRSVGDAGGLVVLPIRSEVKVLNPVASKIYSLLDGKHSRAEIIQVVVGEFDVTEDQAARDFDAFLGELDAAGMLAKPKMENE
jgi:hypothetical protein